MVKNLPRKILLSDLVEETISRNLALVMELEQIKGTALAREAVMDACRLLIASSSPAVVRLYNQQQIARLAGCHRAYLDAKHSPAHITHRQEGKLYGRSCLDSKRFHELLQTLYRQSPRRPFKVNAPMCAMLAPVMVRK